MCVTAAMVVTSCASTSGGPSAAVVETASAPVAAATGTASSTPATEPSTDASAESALPIAAQYPVRRTTFFPEGRVDVVVAYRYAGAPGGLGVVVTEEMTYDHAGELLSSIRYDRDAELVVRTSRLDAEGKLQSQHLFQHDAGGRVLVDTTEDGAGRVRSESQYAYDGEGRRTVWRLLGGRRELLGRSVYRYSDTDLVEVENFDGAGALQETISFSRDGQRRLTSEVVRDAIGRELSRDDYMHTGDGLQSVAYFSSGSLVGTERYEYDGVGNLARTDSHGSNDELKSYVIVEYAMSDEILSSP